MDVYFAVQVMAMMEAPMRTGYDRNSKCFLCCLMGRYQMVRARHYSSSSTSTSLHFVASIHVALPAENIAVGSSRLTASSWTAP